MGAVSAGADHESLPMLALGVGCAQAAMCGRAGAVL